MTIEISCNQLKKLYFDDRLSFRRIGEMFGCTKQTIMKKAKGCGIKSRATSDFLHAKGKDSPLWRGGKYVTPAGYIRVQLPDGTKRFEHVVTWENYYGKPKPKGYEIHHLNGVRTDNRIENLVLLSKAGHTRVGNAEAYKARIRQLERENKQLRRQANLL